MSKIQKHAKNMAKKASLVAVTTATSVGAFAADYTTEITAAQTEATANNSGMAAAVIGVTAVFFGLGLLVAWLKR